MMHENNMVNLNNVAYREQTLIELPHTPTLRYKGNHNYARNSLEAANTRKVVRELRTANLSMTMSEIAKRAGISRQRVFQILLEEGLPTKRRISITKFQYQCFICGTISPYKFCSDECKKKWQQIPVVCTRCGKLFFRKTTQLLHNYRNHNRGLFCSKICSGRWLAETYEFKSNGKQDKPSSLA